MYGGCSKTTLGILKRLQNFLRCITFLSPRESAEQLYEKYRVLTVEELYIYDLLKLALKSLATNTHRQLSTIFLSSFRLLIQY